MKSMHYFDKTKNNEGYVPYTTITNKDYLFEFFWWETWNFNLQFWVWMLQTRNFHVCIVKLKKKCFGGFFLVLFCFLFFFFWTGKMRTSNTDMKEYSKKKTFNYGSLYPRLLNIDLDHIVIDELYLMIRKWMCYLEILLKIR